MKTFIMAVITTAAMLIVVTPTEARKCDGFSGCRCGVTAARLHGLPLNYHGLNLKEARAYYNFPRTSCHAGAIGVQPHHVYTVISCNGDGTAQVHDDAGIYTRRVAGNTFVDANSNASAPVREAHLRHHYRHYRHYGPQYAPQYEIRYASYNY